MNWPTELIMLNADCQSAGRTGSPSKVYLSCVSATASQSPLLGICLPKIPSEGWHTDHCSVDLSVESPVSIQVSEGFIGDEEEGMGNVPSYGTHGPEEGPSDHGTVVFPHMLENELVLDLGVCFRYVCVVLRGGLSSLLDEFRARIYCTRFLHR